MKLIHGKIIAAERVRNIQNQKVISHQFTIETFDVKPEITLGADVIVADFVDCDEEDLRTLRAYLKDLPALTDDKEVKRDIMALNTLLGTPTADL